MNAKQRVLTTVGHKEPDRVPVGEWGIDHDHVSKILGRHTYWRNRKDTTLAVWENRRDEAVQSMKEDYAELVEKLDYELVTVPLVPPKGRCENPPRKIADGVWEDSRGRVYKYASSNDSIVCVTHSEGLEDLSEEQIEAAIASADQFDESVFELVDYFGERFGKDRAVLFRDMSIYSPMIKPFGGDYNHQMMVTLLAPETILRLHEAVVRYNLKLIEHCEKHNVAIMMQGYDFCMNSGSIVSPATMRELFFPAMKTVNSMVREHGMHSFFHCCGNTTDILGDFVDAGYDGYQSIQLSAGLDNAVIKQKYGNRLTMWTGVQCETLITATPDQAGREVRQSLETLMPGGGFIFGSTNSVQYGASTENYLRALDTVRKYGVYR